MKTHNLTFLSKALILVSSSIVLASCSSTGDGNKGNYNSNTNKDKGSAKNTQEKVSFTNGETINSGSSRNSQSSNHAQNKETNKTSTENTTLTSSKSNSKSNDKTDKSVTDKNSEISSKFASATSKSQALTDDVNPNDKLVIISKTNLNEDNLETNRSNQTTNSNRNSPVNTETSSTTTVAINNKGNNGENAGGSNSSPSTRSVNDRTVNKRATDFVDVNVNATLGHANTVTNVNVTAKAPEVSSTNSHPNSAVNVGASSSSPNGSSSNNPVSTTEKRVAPKVSPTETPVVKPSVTPSVNTTETPSVKPNIIPSVTPTTGPSLYIPDLDQLINSSLTDSFPTEKKKDSTSTSSFTSTPSTSPSTSSSNNSTSSSSREAGISQPTTSSRNSQENVNSREADRNLFQDLTLNQKQSEVNKKLSSDSKSLLEARWTTEAVTKAFVNRHFVDSRPLVNVKTNNFGLVTTNYFNSLGNLVDNRIAKILVLESSLSNLTHASHSSRLTVDFINNNNPTSLRVSENTYPFTHGEMVVNRLLTPPNVMYNYHPSMFATNGLVHFLGYDKGDDRLKRQYELWISNPKTRQAVERGYNIINVSWGHFTNFDDIASYYNQNNRGISAQDILRRNNNNLMQTFKEMNVLRGNALEMTVNNLNGFARDNDASIVIAKGNFQDRKYNMDIFLAESNPEKYRSLLDSYLVVTSYNVEEKEDFYSNSCQYAEAHCIVAPGRNTLYTNKNYDPNRMGVIYHYERNPVTNGTSFAAPYVASVVGLVKSVFPFMDNKALQTTILTTAKKLHVDGSLYSKKTGWGLVQPQSAVLGPKHFYREDMLVDLRKNQHLMRENQEFLFSNSIDGNHGLIIKGNNKKAILTLAGNNSYRGSTVVANSGRLNIKGTLLNSLLSIEEGSSVFSAAQLASVTNSGNFHAYQYNKALGKPIFVKEEEAKIFNSPRAISNPLLSKEGFRTDEYYDSPIVKNDFFQNPNGTLSVYLGQPLLVNGQASLLGTLRVDGIKRAIINKKGEIYDEILISSRPIYGDFNRVEFNSPLLSNVYNLEKVTYDIGSQYLYSYVLKTFYRGFAEALTDGALDMSKVSTQGVANLDAVAAYVFPNANRSYGNRSSYNKYRGSYRDLDDNNGVSNPSSGRDYIILYSKQEADGNTKVSKFNYFNFNSEDLDTKKETQELSDQENKELASKTEEKTSASKKNQEADANTAVSKDNIEAIQESKELADLDYSENFKAKASVQESKKEAKKEVKKETQINKVEAEHANIENLSEAQENSNVKYKQREKEKAASKNTTLEKDLLASHDRGTLGNFIARLSEENNKENLSKTTKAFAGEDFLDYSDENYKTNQELAFNFHTIKSGFNNPGFYGTAQFSSSSGNKATKSYRSAYLGYHSYSDSKFKALINLNMVSSVYKDPNKAYNYQFSDKSILTDISFSPLANSEIKEIRGLELSLKGNASYSVGNLNSSKFIIDRDYSFANSSKTFSFSAAFQVKQKLSINDYALSFYTGQGIERRSWGEIKQKFSDYSINLEADSFYRPYTYLGVNFSKDNLIINNLDVNANILFTYNWKTLENLKGSFSDNQVKVSQEYHQDRSSLVDKLTMQGELSLSYTHRMLKLTIFTNASKYNKEDYSLSTGIKAKYDFKF